MLILSQNSFVGLISLYTSETASIVLKCYMLTSPSVGGAAKNGGSFFQQQKKLFLQKVFNITGEDLRKIEYQGAVSIVYVLNPLLVELYGALRLTPLFRVSSVCVIHLAFLTVFRCVSYAGAR